jgi:RNA polymerase sigma factor (sigma-70 family)
LKPAQEISKCCLLLEAVVTWKDVTLEFDAWYHAEYQRLVNSIALVIGDRQLAADAVAEGFTRALARWDRVRRMSHPTGWVYRVAMNEAKRAKRRGSHERRLLEAQAASTPATVAPVEGDHELWQAVSRLPERMRAVVVLRYVADLTEPMIAETLGIRRGSVATMLRRAHDRLASELGPASQSFPPATPSQEFSNAIR